MKSSGIYVIRHLDGRAYVGSSSDLSRRTSCHQSMLASGKHPNKKLQRAWLKYGKSVFTFEIIELVAEIDMLIAREQYWIDALNACKSGFNINPIAGSSRGRPVPDNVKRKISNSLTGRKMSREAVEKSRAARIGKPMPTHVKEAIRKSQVGRKQTKEEKDKRSEKLRGKKRPQYAIDATAAAKRGSTHTAETKALISRKLSGRKVPAEVIAKRVLKLTGRVVSQETKDKISAAQKGRKLSTEHAANAAAGRKRSREMNADRTRSER